MRCIVEPGIGRIILRMALIIYLGYMVSQPVSAWEYNPDKKDQYKNIRESYKQLSDSGHPIGFIKEGDSVVSNNIRQIVLIRHGKPMLNKKGCFSFHDAKKYKFQYDTVHVEPIPEKKFYIEPNEISKIFSSALIRSSHTASLMFADQFDIESDSAFIEFQSRIIKIPLIRMPISWWQGISRFFWWVGLNSSNIETHKEANERARKDAAFLEMETIKSGNAVLVAHGLLNRSIAKTLKKQGWHLSLDTGSDYLSIKIFTNLN